MAELTYRDAVARGMKLVVVDPRSSPEAAKGEWVPIRPGTDGALLLALVHEVIALGLYDRDFLVRYTNAGHLVNLDEASDHHVEVRVAAVDAVHHHDRSSLGDHDRPGVR